jgi:hypothetical protein
MVGVEAEIETGHFQNRISKVLSLEPICLIILFIGLQMFTRACSTNGGHEECIQDIGGKARKKETTRKTKT